MKSKLKFLFQRIPILLTAIASAVILFTPLEVRALEDIGSIVAALTGLDGSNRDTSSGIVNGITYSRTGFIAYLVEDQSGALVSSTLAFKSPGYSEISGTLYIIESRKGDSVTQFEAEPAPWGLPPFNENRSSNQSQIKAWMMQRNSNGVLNGAQFVNDQWGEALSERFITGEVDLVLESLISFQYGYPSNSAKPKQLTKAEVLNQWNMVYDNTKKISTEELELLTDAINDAYREAAASGNHVTKGSPILGTNVNVIDYYNNVIAPNPNWFRIYTHNTMPITMHIDRDIAGFKVFPGSISSGSYLTDGQIQSYGLAMGVFRCVDDGQTTYDESQGETPAPPADESDGKFTIIKSYRKKIGETKYEDEGTFHIKEVAPEITIENEKSHKVVEWRISTTEKTGISSLTWESSVPPSVSDTGKNPTTVKLKDPEKVLYVLLERTEEEPPEPEDYNYLISESTITRRIKMSEPDNQLSMPDILNHTFKWVLPAHKTTCSGHTWTKCKRQVLSSKKWQLISSIFGQLSTSILYTPTDCSVGIFH